MNDVQHAVGLLVAVTTYAICAGFGITLGVLLATKWLGPVRVTSTATATINVRGHTDG